MKRFSLKLLFISLILLGAIAVTRDLMVLNHQRPPPELLGFGPGFTGSAQLPASVIQAAFERANARMLQAFESATRYRLASYICYWLAFVASASVTLILAWFGRTRDTDPGTLPAASQSMSLPTTAVRWITVLSASAAILTAARTPFLDYQQQAATRADGSALT